MRAFSTEKWLERTVSDRGSRDDRRKLDALLRELSFLEGVDVPDADDGRCGLPRDMFMVESQPLQEVEVYRDLGGFEMPEEANKPEDDDEKKAKVKKEVKEAVKAAFDENLIDVNNAQHADQVMANLKEKILGRYFK